MQRFIYVTAFWALSLGLASIATPQAGDTPSIAAPELLSDYNMDVTTAKTRYDAALRAARGAYFKSILAADDRYVARLNVGLKNAMKSQDMQFADRLDQQRVAAVAERQLHFNVGFNGPAVTILKATWSARDRTIDVTDKLKDIVLEDEKSVHAWARAFGDPWPGVPKHMTVSLLVNGDPTTINIAEDAPLPEGLFSSSLPPDDPAFHRPIW